MKRTDLERRERELKRSHKKEIMIRQRVDDRDERSVSSFIDNLFGLFRYDEQEIFNTTDDISILELLEEMKESQPPKQWDNILRKAIKKTKIANKEKAYNELTELLN